MPVERWETPDAVRLTNTTEKQLTYWRRCGLVFPDGRPGSGNTLWWSFDDMLRAMAIRSICPPGRAAERGLPRRIGKRLAITQLDGDYLVLEPYVGFREPEQIIDLLETHPFVTVVPLAPLRAALTDRIAA